MMHHRSNSTLRSLVLVLLALVAHATARGQQPNTPKASAVWHQRNHPQGATGPIPVSLTTTTVTLDVR